MFQKRLKQYAGIAPVPVAVKSGQHHKTGLLSVEEVEKYGYGSIGPLQQIWGTPTHPHSRVDDNAKYGLPFSFRPQQIGRCVDFIPPSGQKNPPFSTGSVARPASL